MSTQNNNRQSYKNGNKDEIQNKEIVDSNDYENCEAELLFRVLEERAIKSAEMLVKKLIHHSILRDAKTKLKIKDIKNEQKIINFIWYAIENIDK
jgi:hypothetical protein